MDINWPEVVIGVAISFVLGGLFTLFWQPRVERRLSNRRTRRQLEIERQNAELAEEVARLAANADLFAARFREGVLRVLTVLVFAGILTLSGLAFAWLPGMHGWSVFFFVGALILTLPVAQACGRLLDLSQGVRTSLEREGQRPE